MFLLRLYTLEGCPECEHAANFLVEKTLPHEVIDARADLIVQAGNRALNNGKDEYPILVNNITKDVVVGWNSEAYDRVWKSFVLCLPKVRP